ncbi:glycosyltransferase [Mucilaginibacter sp.]
MKTIRAVHVLGSIEYSGAEIMLYQASDIFHEHHIHTTLLSGQKKKGQFEGPMLEKGYVIDSVGADGKISGIITFFRYFRNNKFDIVHIHTEDLYLWKVIILKLTGNNNMVRTYHNCWRYKGWLRFKRTIHRRLATLLGVKNHAIGSAVQINEKNVFYNKSVIINNWIKLNPDMLEKKDIVRNLKRAELGINPDSFVIISIGGCSPVKNHSFIINLIDALNNEGLKVVYLHVGTGVDEASEKVLAKNIGVDSQIIFTGNRKDIPELLISSDLYLMPSSVEGLSIALLEAMYYNGLVIVNDAPGLTNMIVKNETGYVINVEDKLAYINLIRKIINNDVDITKIKSGAKAFVEKNFALEKNARELIGFYKQRSKFSSKSVETSNAT